MDRRMNSMYKLFFASFFTLCLIFITHIEYIKTRQKIGHPDTFSGGNINAAASTKRIDRKDIIKVEEMYRVSAQELQLEKLRFSMESKLWYKNSAVLIFPKIPYSVNPDITIYINTSICQTSNRPYNNGVFVNSYQIYVNNGLSLISNHYWLIFQQSFCKFPDYKKLQNAYENENKEYIDSMMKNYDQTSPGPEPNPGCSVFIPCNQNVFVKVTIAHECAIYKYNIEFGGIYERGDW
jgi:hypothetical protein